MLRKHLQLAAALGALVIGASPAFAQAQAEGQAQTGGVVNPEAEASAQISPGVEEAREQEVPLDEVPEAAVEAAKGALEVDPEEAYFVILADGRKVYEIEATKDGEEVAVYVTSAGEIVGREQEEAEREAEEEEDVLITPEGSVVERETVEGEEKQ